MLELSVFKIKSSSLLQKLQQEYSARDSSQPRTTLCTVSKAPCRDLLTTDTGNAPHACDTGNSEWQLSASPSLLVKLMVLYLSLSARG